MPFMWYDPTYILVIPALLFSLYAQIKVQAVFSQYLRVRARSGWTGREVARDLLLRNGAGDVRVESIRQPLGDHFDPRVKALRLSPQVYDGDSIAALSVAAHESGHAVQNASRYTPLAVRQAILPVASFGSSAAFPIFILGMLFGSGETGEFLMSLGIWLFVGVVIFQLLTLPVEFNASARALTMLTEGGYISEGEVPAARKVLEAAALTYVAATATAITQLLRLLVLRNSRRD